MTEGEPQTRASILALANVTFGDETLAKKWLKRPKQRFGGKTASGILATTDGTKRVEEVLLQAFFGNVG